MGRNSKVKGALSELSNVSSGKDLVNYLEQSKKTEQLLIMKEIEETWQLKMQITLDKVLILHRGAYGLVVRKRAVGSNR